MTDNVENTAEDGIAAGEAMTRGDTRSGGSVAGSAPQEPGMAFAILTVGTRPEPFRIDDAAFDAWCQDKGDELECDMPDWRSERPGADLSSMVLEACEHGVITGDRRLRLDCFGDDDTDGSGFYVMVRNRCGPQQWTHLTSGWNELEVAREGFDPRGQARDYLDTVCLLANEVIDGGYPQRVAGATANMLTLELSDGSCATWVLPDAEANVVAASIETQCGPPDSLRC